MIADSSERSRHDPRPSVDREPDVTEQRLVEDGVDRGSVVAATLRLAAYSGAFGRARRRLASCMVADVSSRHGMVSSRSSCLVPRCVIEHMFDSMSEVDLGLGRAIDELAAIDPSTLSPTELHDLVIELMREESRLRGRQGGAGRGVGRTAAMGRQRLEGCSCPTDARRIGVVPHRQARAVPGSPPANDASHDRGTGRGQALDRSRRPADASQPARGRPSVRAGREPARRPDQDDATSRRPQRCTRYWRNLAEDEAGKEPCRPRSRRTALQRGSHLPRQGRVRRHARSDRRHHRAQRAAAARTADVRSRTGPTRAPSTATEATAGRPAAHVRPTTGRRARARWPAGPRRWTRTR